MNLKKIMLGKISNRDSRQIEGSCSCACMGPSFKSLNLWA